MIFVSSVLVLVLNYGVWVGLKLGVVARPLLEPVPVDHKLLMAKTTLEKRCGKDPSGSE